MEDTLLVVVAEALEVLVIEVQVEQVEAVMDIMVVEVLHNLEQPILVVAVEVDQETLQQMVAQVVQE